MKIPKNLQSVFWSSDIDELDLSKDKSYIIHQILIYGTLTDIKWLFKQFSRQDILDTFIRKPRKIYPPEVYHFTKNYLLGLKDIHLAEDQYVTTVFGPLRQRATGNIL